MKKGVKITHDIKEITEGKDIIFTLKDQYILNDLQNDVNLETDALENAYFNEKKRSEENLKLRMKRNQESLDFNEKKGLLSKYDKEEEKEFYIESNDKEEKSSSNELNSIKEKLSMLSEKIRKEPKLINLNFEKVNFHFNKKFVSDYFTSNEMNNFKKPKITKIKKNVSSLIEELRNENSLPVTSINNNKTNFSSDFDEYNELEKLLEKQRLFSQIKNVKSTEEIINEYIKDSKDEKNAVENQSSNYVSNKDSKEDFVLLSDTTEFLKSVPSKLEVEENMRLISQSPYNQYNNNLSGTQSIAYIPLASERLKSGITSVIPNSDFLAKKRLYLTEDETNDDNSHFNESGTQENVSSLAEIMGEDDQTIGITGTLNLLKKRGLLGKTDYSGRNKDRDPEKEMEKFPKSASDRIKLEYRDNKGKLMTSKEAFRYGCWIFHNKKPGKKKLEKKLLKEQLDEKLKNKDASLDSKFMSFLKTEQDKSKLPYVILQKK